MEGSFAPNNQQAHLHPRRRMVAELVGLVISKISSVSDRRNTTIGNLTIRESLGRRVLAI
jgi:hypothetical protein